MDIRAAINAKKKTRKTVGKVQQQLSGIRAAAKALAIQRSKK